MHKSVRSQEKILNGNAPMPLRQAALQKADKISIAAAEVDKYTIPGNICRYCSIPDFLEQTVDRRPFARQRARHGSILTSQKMIEIVKSSAGGIEYDPGNEKYHGQDHRAACQDCKRYMTDEPRGDVFVNDHGTGG